MRRISLLLLLLSVLCSTYALTGFGISDFFSITETTLPVELSSFTAIATSLNKIQINWVTQSEANLVGYRIYRNSINVPTSALCISPLIPSTNNSTMQSYVYTDSEASVGLWFYWLEVREYDGTNYFHGPVSVTLYSDGMQEIPGIPLTYGIQSIYPNPFSSNTIVSIGLSKSTPMKVDIFNLKGALVRSLYTGSKDAGTYRMAWDGTDHNNRACSGGIYILKLSAEGKITQAKLTLMK